MAEESVLRPCKVVVVGDDGVGKTALLITYTSGRFPVDYIPTVFDNYSPGVGPAPPMGLWDTAGAEEYDRLRPLSYPQTDVMLVCFAIDSRESFESVRSKWIPEIAEEGLSDVGLLLVGLKCDVRAGGGDVVGHEEGVACAEDIGAEGYYECSSLALEGVADVFDVVMELHRSREGRGRGRTRCCVQ